MAKGNIDNDWWKKSIIYQIYPRSFQDSNGDGIGDLKGIESRLEHFKYLHVDALWLSPIYKSPMVDFGYDVSDFVDIDPAFGTLQDFDDLLKAMHQRDMKLIVDFIPNHTSDKHQWFVESCKGGEGNLYKDYYVLNDGKLNSDGTRSPPNNWLSIFGGSAWQWVEARKQFYLHQFCIEQPDLNYRNPVVRQKMTEVLKFWIDRGVDGFRIDAIATLFEAEHLKDEPRSFLPGISENENEYLNHIYTQHLNEIHTVVGEWRAMMNQFEKKTGKHIFMVMEVYDKTLDETMKYYHSGADLPFNFNLIFANEATGGLSVKNIVQQWMDKMPAGAWPNFVIGNHDQKRITTRKGLLYANAMNMLLLTLPGTPTTYNGEEIGQLDIEVSFEDTQDPYGKNLGPELYQKYSRHVCRGPMQWTDETHAGFTTAKKPWLPVHPDYKTRNVKVQRADKSGNQPLQVYRQLALLRRDVHFQNSWFDYVVVNENVISYVRGLGHKPSYIVAMNLGGEKTTDNYTVTGKEEVLTKGEVVVTTGKLTDSGLTKGSVVSLEALTLHPGEGFVAKLVPSKKRKITEEL